MGRVSYRIFFLGGGGGGGGGDAVLNHTHFFNPHYFDAHLYLSVYFTLISIWIQL